MKKIILSILAIVALVGVVGGAAYAQFTTTADINGITISAGNAGLKITLPSDTLVLDKIHPGYSQTFDITIENTSESPIGLDLTGQLTSAPGDWSFLKDNVRIRLTDNYADDTGALSLDQWNTAPRSFGSTLSNADTRTYHITVSVPFSVGNDIADKEIHDVTFVVTGTQHE
jgi:hypothetical protein